MKIKLFVAREIQYFELGIFSFDSYLHYLTRSFIASTRAFNLLTCAFNLATRAFSLPTHAFNLATRAFSVRTPEFELVTRGFELVTRNSCFTFPPSTQITDTETFSLITVPVFNLLSHKVFFINRKDRNC